MYECMWCGGQQHKLMPKVKNEIDSVLRQGVISPVTVPTEWCTGIVPVPKPNRRVRIFVDLTVERPS